VKTYKNICSRRPAVKVWYTCPTTSLVWLIGVIAMLGWGGTAMAGARDSALHHHPGRTFRLRGAAHGGYQPVSSSTVTLFEVGTTGYGSTPTTLATTTTNASGNWSLPAFTCSPVNAQLYLTAVQGNAGFGNNSALTLIAAIGPCNNLPDSVNINEVTTVASVYALHHFITFTGTRTNVGAPATNATGLANAVAQVPNLVNLVGGNALAITLGGNGIAPRATINTLANLLALCVSSSGPETATCTNFFAAATPVGGTAPVHTTQAIFDIAGNPINNVDQLFALESSGDISPFKPTLVSSPEAWILLVAYTGGGMSVPVGTAIGSTGDIWLSNEGNSKLSEFSPTGVPISSSGISGGPLATPFFIAIDASNDVWVANSGSGTVGEFNPSGVAISPAGGYDVTDQPGTLSGIAIDHNGTVWLEAGPAVFELEGGNTPPASCPTVPTASDTGCLISPLDGYTGGGLLDESLILAIDATDGVWVANANTLNTINSVSELVGGSTPPASCTVPPSATDTGCPISPADGYTGGGLNRAAGVTVDVSNNVWIANQNGDSVTKLVGGTTPPATCPASPGPGDTGCPLSPVGGYTGGGLSSPLNLTSDSAGTIWVVGNGLAALTPGGIPLSPPNSFDNGATSYSDSIDASGNVWFSGLNTNTLREVIGLASPVKTPTIGPPTLP
jgi:hypothetical protein